MKLLSRQSRALPGVTGVARVSRRSDALLGRVGHKDIVILVDGVGEKIFGKVKDGAKIRIDGGAVYLGEEPVAQGTEQSPESVADLMIEAKTGMSSQLEAFAANAIEYMKRERTLLLDGVGVPQISTDLEGKQVLVVSASADNKAQLKSLKKYISDYRPVL